MLYREIIAVCSQIHTKHINTLCGQNVELLNVKLQKLALTSPTGGGRSVGIVRSRTKATEFSLVLVLVKLAVREVITVDVDDKRLKYLASELEFKMYSSYRTALYYVDSKHSEN